MIRSEEKSEDMAGGRSQPLTPRLTPLRSTLIESAGGTIHGVTRRVPGFGKADANISYTSPRDADDAWRNRQAWAREIGVDAGSLVVAWQIHGSKVFRVASADRGSGATPESQTIGKADALISDSTGVTLMTTHADCLPIFVYDPRQQVVGAIHAGWRSTVGGVTVNTMNCMVEEFDSCPADVLAYVGPAICRSCYVVGPEVASAWRSKTISSGSGAITSNGNGKFQFGLVEANVHLLTECGVRSQNIELSNECTRCNGNRWFSHRGQGPATGRFAAMIALSDDQ